MVQETNLIVPLTIQRTQGTFGSVSVFCFAQSSREGATSGEDYKFDPRVRCSAMFVIYLLAASYAGWECHILCRFGKLRLLLWKYILLTNWIKHLRLFSFYVCLFLKKYISNFALPCRMLTSVLGRRSRLLPWRSWPMMCLSRMRSWRLSWPALRMALSSALPAKVIERWSAHYILVVQFWKWHEKQLRLFYNYHL